MKRKSMMACLALLSVLTLVFAGCAGSKKNGGTSETSTEDTSASSTSSSEEEVEAVDKNVFPQLEEVQDNQDVVEMTTSMGKIKIVLYPQYAPKAVDNFLTLAKKGYYDGVTFHRVIKEFMIQGGDPDGTGMGGESKWGENFAPEISSQLFHIRGALSMARSGGDVSLKTQGSQFFIVQNDQDQYSSVSGSYPEKIANAYKKGGYPSLDTQYSVFGQVIEGMDVVDKIASVKVENDKPVKDVTIKSIKILQEAK